MLFNNHPLLEEHVSCAHRIKKVFDSLQYLPLSFIKNFETIITNEIETSFISSKYTFVKGYVLIGKKDTLKVRIFVLNEHLTNLNRKWSVVCPYFSEVSME